MPTSHNHDIALVINTRSRKAERFFFEVLDLLIAAGKDVDLFPVRETKHLSEAVETAIRHGNKTVIIGGGDGTVSAMIGHFVHTDVTLGIIPLGTANSYIRSLDIPNDPRAAVEVILHGKTAVIDVGKMNDTYFANAASFGFTTRIAEGLSQGNIKKYFGVLAYALQGITQVFTMKPFSVTVERPGTPPETLTTYQVIVANGSFYGPTALAKQATVNSEKLVLLTMKEMGRRSLLWAWLTTFFGKNLSQSTSQSHSGESFTLTSHPNQPVSVDGELKTAKKLAFTIVPNAVHVRVPSSFKKLKTLKSN